MEQGFYAVDQLKCAMGKEWIRKTSKVKPIHLKSQVDYKRKKSSVAINEKRKILVVSEVESDVVTIKGSKQKVFPP